MAALISVALSGCAEDGISTDDEHVVRNGSEPEAFWELRADHEANGPVAVHEGDPPTLPLCIIWDIDGGEGIHEGPIEDGILVATMEENRVVAPDGNIECVASQEGNLYKLRDVGSGEVLYTATHGRFVFEGDVDVLPPPGSPEYRSLHYDRLALEFYGDRLFDEPGHKGETLATADAVLQYANPMRKLTLAAMYGGDCGSNGPRDPMPGPITPIPVNPDPSAE